MPLGLHFQTCSRCIALLLLLSSNFLLSLGVYLDRPVVVIKLFGFFFKICFDEWNSRCFTIGSGHCFSFECLSRASIMTISCLAHNFGRFCSSLQRKISRVICSVQPICVPRYPKLCSFLRTTSSTDLTKTMYFC